ncbi:uncharacterized protein Dere_GG23660 [Drosophila erecta]|uniref:AB hydrolase-1 domain-containing protein n=1 Tax=Drosophila erecta TaxID=7220 RepID=B3N560_DROER|nr:uncharacterized protein Dere_GG23660 [Drosophila erecta]
MTIILGLSVCAFFLLGNVEPGNSQLWGPYANPLLKLQGLEIGVNAQNLDNFAQSQSQSQSQSQLESQILPSDATLSRGQPFNGIKRLSEEAIARPLVPEILQKPQLLLIPDSDKVSHNLIQKQLQSQEQSQTQEQTPAQKQSQYQSQLLSQLQPQIQSQLESNRQSQSQLQDQQQAEIQKFDVGHSIPPVSKQPIYIFDSLPQPQPQYVLFPTQNWPVQQNPNHRKVIIPNWSTSRRRNPFIILPQPQELDPRKQLQSQQNSQSSGSQSQLQSTGSQSQFQSQLDSQSSGSQSQLQSQLDSQSSGSQSQLQSQLDSKSDGQSSGSQSQFQSQLGSDSIGSQSQFQSQLDSQSSGSQSQLQSQLDSQSFGSQSQLQSLLDSKSDAQSSGSQSQLGSDSTGSQSQFQSQLDSQSSGSQSQLQSQLDSQSSGSQSQLQSLLGSDSTGSQSQFQSQLDSQSSGSQSQLQSQLDSQSSGSQSQLQSQLDSKSGGQSSGSQSQLQTQLGSDSTGSQSQFQSQLDSQSSGSQSQLQSQLDSQASGSQSQSQSQLNSQSLGSQSQSQLQARSQIDRTALPESLIHIHGPFPHQENLAEANRLNRFKNAKINVVTSEYEVYNPPNYLTHAEILDNSRLTTVDLIEKYGYPSETNYVTSEDGYKLCLHRIPRPGAVPVLLVHGLLASSASWVELGPKDGLAYILYRKGYDVWMLNTRGNKYSRENFNRRLRPRKYWDFSFHEIGKFDVPAAIDHILVRTHKPKIQYIGHSQGSTVFFVMCSERPKYAHKVHLMQALSPTVYLRENRSPVLKFLGMFKGKYSMLLNLLGGYEISAKTRLIQQFRQHICSGSELASRICAIFDFVLCGFDWKSFNETLTPIVAAHASQGASAKQIYHYAQLQGDLNFQRFDHGAVLNRVRYESSEPPAYNLSQTISKVVLHHGGGDWLGSTSDVIRLQERLPNLVESRKVSFDGFSHFDFTISKDVRPLLYSHVLRHMAAHLSG